MQKIIDVAFALFFSFLTRPALAASISDKKIISGRSYARHSGNVVQSR